MFEVKIGRGAGSHALWVGNVGNDNVHWESFEKIPPQGGLQADGETTLERTGHYIGVSLAGGRDGRGGITEGGDLCLPPIEHSRTVYCGQAHYIPMSVVGAEDWVMGGQEVVGAGRIGLGGDVDSGLGGITDGREEETDGTDTETY